MKCPSCGYEKRTQTIRYDEAYFYQKGKNKGLIKGSERKEHTVYENDPKFVKIVSFMEDKIEMDFYRHYDGDDPFSILNFTPTGLYACPKCGTIISMEINEENWW